MQRSGLNSKIGGLDSLVIQDRLPGFFYHNLSVFQNKGPVGDREGMKNILLHQKNGNALRVEEEAWGSGDTAAGGSERRRGGRRGGSGREPTERGGSGQGADVPGGSKEDGI